MKSYDPRLLESKAALKRTIKRLLREDDGDAAPAAAPPEEKDTSLDAQVDRYFGEYESEAKSVQTEGVSFRSMMQRFLREAEGDTTGNDAPADDSAGDLGGDDAPTKLGPDKIDVEGFANSIVRLIDNYDSLLEVRSTITRRAKNFLAKTYSDEVVSSFDNVMRDEHGITPGESKDDIDAEEFPAPGADRAGADSGSGGAPA